MHLPRDLATLPDALDAPESSDYKPAPDYKKDDGGRAEASGERLSQRQIEDADHEAGDDGNSEGHDQRHFFMQFHAKNLPIP
jgi:hypothetical protein